MSQQTSPALLLAKLEARIHDLGKTPPAPWPWVEQDPAMRRLQLLEFIEDVEAGRNTDQHPKWKRKW
jgi:hypothetical protein